MSTHKWQLSSVICWYWFWNQYVCCTKSALKVQQTYWSFSILSIHRLNNGVPLRYFETLTFTPSPQQNRLSPESYLILDWSNRHNAASGTSATVPLSHAGLTSAWCLLSIPETYYEKLTGQTSGFVHAVTPWHLWSHWDMIFIWFILSTYFVSACAQNVTFYFGTEAFIHWFT